MPFADSWRLIPRVLILTAVGLGALSFIILLVGSLVPFIKKKPNVMNAWRIASSVVSSIAGKIGSQCALIGDFYNIERAFLTKIYLHSLKCFSNINLLT